MTREEFILIVKGVCFVVIGAFTPWTSALAQWASDGTWPNKIIWIGVILPASLVGAASALLGFLNQSYTDYAAAKGAGAPPPTETETPAQKPAIK